MKIGFIGTGNMGSAMIKGIVTSEAVSGNDINVFDVNVEKSRELSEKYNVKPLQNEVEVVDNS
ncbi:MAG: NAD(P)-binding domain-containing protein, partial [Leptotrichia sp.]|nr:NAD(P)-binding domain-containing protein [Leptotrichia sp.]